MPTTNPSLRNRPNWVELTRRGMPQFIVARRPMLLNNVTLPAGSALPIELVEGQRARLQRLYELALIEPVLGMAQSTAKAIKKVAVQAIPTPMPNLAYDLPEIETPVAVADEPEIDMEATINPVITPDLSRFFASARKPNKNRKKRK